MKFWKFLRWGGFVLFLCMLLAAWYVRDRQHIPADEAQLQELPRAPVIR